MAFELEKDYVLINNEEFEIVREKNTKKAYFAERVALRGELNFGLVSKNNESFISLADSGIKTPIIIDSIVAMSGETTADEIVFNLYRKNPLAVNNNQSSNSGSQREPNNNSTENQLQKVGTQRYSNSEMPVDFPDGIVYPDMVISAVPKRADASIVVYCKPVIVLFQATAQENSNT